MFNPNDGFLYVIVTIVILFVIIESIFFLVKAWRRAKALKMDKKLLQNTVVSSAIFTIAPAVAILLGVIALSKALGFPLPWLRLSVIGALTYETTAAATAAAAQGVTLGNLITDPQVFAAIAWVMTLGIIPGLVLVPVFSKKIENGLTRIKSKDQKWGDIFLTGLFLGMISAFLGVIFATIGQGLVGWIPVFVMIASAIIMLICGLLRKLFQWKWLEDYALPISMLGAMALSLPITNLVTAIAG
ncbi:MULTISPECIES: DUF5058 family protein [unclassified Clostridium]|uniref:DUF5058 family protein n=1 Tax=unclassified Clostridium TaxID=2614128 RepID=UPI00110602EC|nr:MULTISPECIES: DUF5058 family protein [unclassified Clostridium]